MAVLAALLDSPGALQSLRKSVPGGARRVSACRALPALASLLERRLVDAVVLGPRALRSPTLAGFQIQYPTLPVVVYGAFRPDDGELLFRLGGSAAVAAVAVEGVDDTVVGEVVLARSWSASRRVALADAPRLLRLTEPIQLAAWGLLLDDACWTLSTEGLAARLQLSRGHLSRQFAAGGAPNLKRVQNFLRIFAAAQLLVNPGYHPATVARVLGFATTSHLHSVSRRTTGLPATRLASLRPTGLLSAFVREGMRSRSG